MLDAFRCLSNFQLEDDKVHEMLIAFKNRHYSASSMTLAIQSQHELDELQAWVEESFADVPNSATPRQTFNHLLQPFKTPGSFHTFYPPWGWYQSSALMLSDLAWAIYRPGANISVKNNAHFLYWRVGPCDPAQRGSSGFTMEDLFHSPPFI